jgi:hypothetical protein
MQFYDAMMVHLIARGEPTSADVADDRPLRLPMLGPIIAG